MNPFKALLIAMSFMLHVASAEQMVVVHENGCENGGRRMRGILIIRTTLSRLKDGQSTHGM